jgi:hypothetical protein
MLMSRVGVLLAQAPAPTGPDAPADVEALVTKGLNLALFVVLAVSFGMALWGAGSMAYAKKKQNFGGVNDGQQTLVLAIGGAALTTVIRGVFGFFGL